MMPASQQIAITRGMNTEMMNHHLHQPQMYGRDPFRRRSTVARAPSMKWTSTLHSHFLHAVQLLGGHERATPKPVLELMNVKDLNLVHVKGHLRMQWYRRLKRIEKASGGSSSSSTESDNGVNLELTLGRPN